MKSPIRLKSLFRAPKSKPHPKDVGQHLWRFCPLLTDTSTRLLVLHPGQPDDDIRCSVRQVDLNDNPEYDDISYTWASPINQKTIFFDREPVQIRHNLYMFLYRVRCTEHDVLHWVDALSISQTDLREKAQQVAMIGRIFKQASCVRA